MKFNAEGFKLICNISKDSLYDWLTKEMTKYYGEKNVVCVNGYLFCVGNINMMLCAHIDTVHKELPSEIWQKTVDSEKNLDKKQVLWSPQGIGGDDRCGVYAILSILKELGEGVKPYLFFSTDEETGGSTTKKAAKEIQELIYDINFLIELDRQGTEDSVYYKCGNKDFKKWIDSFGFVEAQGTFTDICTLCSTWKVAGVNLSIGYEKQHTKDEVVYPVALMKTVKKVINIINDTKKELYFPYAPVVDMWENKNKYNTETKSIIEQHGWIWDVATESWVLPKK